MDWHILTMLPLLGLQATWRGVRIGGQVVGDVGGFGASNNPLVQAFDKAKAAGDREGMEKAARQLNEQRMERKRAKESPNGGGAGFGDGTHAGGLSFEPSVMDAYAKKTGLSMQQVEDRAYAVRSYTATAYTQIRADQRAGKPNATADLIESHLKDSTPYKGEIYRGMSIRPGSTVEDLRRSLESGTTSLNSWTSSNAPATGFLAQQSRKSADGRTPVLLRAKNKTGASIRELSSFELESEVLVGRGARYRVTKQSTQTFQDPVKDSNFQAIVLDLEEL
jgi:hypothetical protein